MSCEIVTITETSAATASITSLDLLTGSSHSSYPSYGSVQTRTLCNLADEFWVFAGKDSQILHFIPIRSSPKVQSSKLICSGRISAVAISRCNAYIFVGIGPQTFLWHIASGDLLAILDGPFQPVSVIAVNDYYAVVGSEDGSVTMWQVNAIIRKHEDNVNEISHTWRKHTASVTDLTVGRESIAFSSSLDSTIQIYNLEKRAVLMSVLFDHPIHSIATDSTLHNLFCGSSCGKIFLTKLYKEPESNTPSRSGHSGNSVFSGHTGKVVVLSVSTDGSILTSGSDDNTLKVWNIASRQCIRSINYKGPVVNISIDLKKNKSKNVNVPIAKIFNRTLKKTVTITSLLAEGCKKGDLDEFKPIFPSKVTAHKSSASQDDIDALKSANKRLYELAVARTLDEF